MKAEINDWLARNAEMVPSTIPDDDDGFVWITRSRGDYITRAGMEDEWLIPMLLKYGITDHISSPNKAGNTVAIGFNPVEHKWYGWSHRAIYGFGVGSKCEKGDSHYRAVDKDDFLEDMVRFWTEDDHLHVRGEHREKGVYIEWEVSQNVQNEKMHGKITGCHQNYPDEYGRGEWEALTLTEARRMAIDFANSVS